MTAAENERLAVVETKVGALTEIVSRMEGKVDQVVLFMTAEQATRQEQTRESQFRRWLAPILITMGNFLFTAFNFFQSRLVAH